MKKEKLRTILENSEFFNDELVIHDNFIETIKIIKDYFGFNTITNMTAEAIGEGFVEIVYYLYSEEDKEELKILTQTKQDASSIAEFFPAAQKFQDRISADFSLNFA